MDYWKECVSQAFDEAGIKATDEQISMVAQCVEGAHDNYSMAFGYDVASANFVSDAERQLERMRDEQRKHDDWVSSTDPCRDCTTNGWTKDGWGRDQTCMTCNGKGRVRRWP